MTKLSTLALSTLLYSGCGIALPVPVFTSHASAMYYDESLDDYPIFVDWWHQNYFSYTDEDGNPLYPLNPTPAQRAQGAPPFTPNSQFHYTPMPQPGGAHGGAFTGWMSWLLTSSMERIAENNSPVAILIRERNSPFPFHANGNPVEPNALADALEALPKLDYLFMDLEANQEINERNIREVVRLVRSHPNPEISNAYIGNYADYPGALNTAHTWDNMYDRTGGASYGGQTGWDRHNWYYESGMNVAMPVLYQYESYSTHLSPRFQRQNPVSPNARSAIFWAPIEHLSVAARELPTGHKLVPWVSNYVDYRGESNMYFAPPPPAKDIKALIQHAYLRGADGYALFTPDSNQTDHPTIGYQELRDISLEAWEEVAELLEGETRIEILNLGTQKARGVEWSGIRSETKAVILVSNLAGNNRAAVQRLPEIEGLPYQTAPVADGKHRIFVYDLPEIEVPQTTNDDTNEDPADDGSDAVTSTDPDTNNDYNIATITAGTGGGSGGGGGGGGGGSGGGGGGGGGGGIGSAPSGGGVSSNTSTATSVVRITRSSGSASSAVSKTEGGGGGGGGQSSADTPETQVAEVTEE
ncbi:MAG: hypothetical protein JJ974_08545 [Phycisphaerales bacterium]|nr:hypothetical protein [Phycisphaerales bacterium]